MRMSYRRLTKKRKLIACNSISSSFANEVKELKNNQSKIIYHYFIVDQKFAKYLKKHTDEIVLHENNLDLNVWCVTHTGIAWNRVFLETH